MFTGRKMTNESGATMVEAAIVVPILLLLLTLVLDGGLLARSQLSARYGATDGARDGAVAGRSPSADYEILQAVARASGAASSHSIIKVVVFKADKANGKVPPLCLVAPQPGLCNVYGDGDLTRPETDFGTTAWTGDDNWPSSSRVVGRTAGTDFVGVYILMKANTFTGILPKQVHSEAVTRIEATAY